MQLGFVIDHSRCIGCHACTVACKAENDVPLGAFRTWVKYTEQGEFPEVRRSFAVLRCNQCSSAPCVTICPVNALEKRADGIVDVDPAACIGCKACMQGCPYDALYINDSTGTAEKCHFCAHRTERGLAPACAVVCPTEAIIPGDFHDPSSVVSRMKAEHDLSARKVEAGTGPNVLYLEAAEAGIDPLQTNAAGGYLWANRLPGVQLEAERFLAVQEEAEQRAGARTTYNVDHPPLWGWKVSAYLFTKSLAAGLFLVLALLMPKTWKTDTLIPLPATANQLAFGALLFLALTTLLLVVDLKHPKRFLYILLRPNWDSWLTRGALVLVAYGVTVTVWLLVDPVWFAPLPLTALLRGVGIVLAALTAGYTGWLFGQAKGRVLWMRRGLWLHLIIQALAAGAALTLLVAPLIELTPPSVNAARWALVAALVLHALFTLTESRMAPTGREQEYARTLRLISKGPFAVKHYVFGMTLGIAAPLVLLALTGSPGIWSVAGALALVGLYIEEDILVRAGQALPIS